jgi:chitosanase
MFFSRLPNGIGQPTAKLILQVLNVFETGSKAGKYDGWAVFADYEHNGNRYRQITYGRSQTTEFGNLKRLLEMYVNATGANPGFANTLRTYLPRIGRIVNGFPRSLWEDAVLKQTLLDAARQDAVMRHTQDVFFDRYYFQPACDFFEANQFTLPLSLLVIYDSYIHSGSIRKDIRDKFPEVPPKFGGREKVWIRQYVDARHNWLANHSKPELHNTVYRTNLFKRLLADDNWQLTKPFTTQGVSFP